MKKSDVVLWFFCFFIWVPILIILSSAFMGSLEIRERFAPVFGVPGEMVRPSFLPDYPTLKPLFQLLLDSPEFFIMFWNSLKQMVPVLLGQLLFAVPAAWAFGVYQFPGRRILLLLYGIVMLLPFQVTMVSSYLVLNRFGLMDTHFAIILPGMFSAFPVFILVKSFEAIPKSLFEAARMDGGGERIIFVRVGIPLARAGICAVVLLGFFECWNSIEQPITFLKDKGRWPLSLYLAAITWEQASTAFMAAAVMMVPCSLLCILGEEYLREGILASGIKE